MLNNEPMGTGWVYGNNTYKIILPDGQLVAMEKESTDTPTSASEYLRIYVDVNGVEKGPNRLGKDLFDFCLYKNGFTIETYRRYSDTIHASEFLKTCDDYFCCKKICKVILVSMSLCLMVGKSKMIIPGRALSHYAWKSSFYSLIFLSQV